MIGRQIGPYKVGRLIGQGGMGVVHEAVHERFGQRAAVKTLKPERSENAKYRERFLREARACCKVEHPGLVRILDCGELDDSQLFILMEYLDGVTLRERLTHSQRLGVETSLRLIQQVAAAMDVAHRNGIVHRDLKPDNVMLLSDGATALGERAKVLDFGIAKFIGAEALPTLSTTGIVGTPTYMSPEHCSKGDDVDGKSDVYALGCMFYEMLCGRPPFDDTPDAMCLQHLHGTPVPPRKRESAIPPAVDMLIMSMLRKDPLARPDMAEVAAEITHLLSSPRQLRASPLAVWLRRCFRSPRRGTRIALFASMPLLLLCLALLIYIAWPSLPPPDGATATIEGGEFTIGIDDGQYTDAAAYVAKGYSFYIDHGYLERERPQHLVRLSTFSIDVTEVTYQQFAEWLNDLRAHIEVDKENVYLKEQHFDGDERRLLFKMDNNPDSKGISFEKEHFFVIQGSEQRPVNAVTWEGANEYCRAKGKRLPTEAQWEFAARSRGKYLYPWGDQRPTCDDATIERGPNFYACKNKKPRGLPNVRSSERDLTEQGVYDMAGSVSEWVGDWLYPYSACGSPCLDPDFTKKRLELKAPERRVVRGGAWSMDFPSARATGRLSMENDVDASTGFRCVSQVK